MFYRSLTRILTLFFAVFFLATLGSTPLVDTGGTYHVSHWNEEIVINEDASLTISEEMTFRFVTGDFGFAYRTIHHKGFDDMISISVTDDEGNSLEYSFALTDQGRNYKVEWKWPRIYVGSEPVEKTFVLNYTLTNAMNYENTDPDRDRFYFNIVTDFDVIIYDVNVDVVLPSMYDLNSISATSYCSGGAVSPPETSNSTTHTIVSYHQPYMYGYTLDMYFPATVKRPPPPPPHPMKAPLDILAPWYSIGMIALGIAAVVKVKSFKRRFKDPEVSTTDTLADQPPADIRPPEAGVLSDMKVRRKHFDSALFDLAQRGYLEMHVESREGGFFRKSVEVESFRVTLTEKGKKAFQSKDPDLRRYEWNLLKSVDARPLTKIELSMITAKELKKSFGLEVVKDELIEKGLVDPEGFDKKGTNLMILGGVVALLGLAFMILYVFVGSANWWMNVTTFFPALVCGLGRTTGPRTVRGATLYKQSNNFLENKMKKLKERAVSSPLLTIQQINELTPWLILHPTFYGLLRAPDRAMKNLVLEDKQHTDILPSYIKLIGSKRQTMPPIYFTYCMWLGFYAIASPSTGAPPAGGGFGGGAAGGGAAGGGGGAG